MFNINTYNKQCEEEFDEKFFELEEEYPNLYKEIKSSITTSNTTLLKKFLESERERLESTKEDITEANDYAGDPSKWRISIVSYNLAIQHQLTHINNLLETLK